MKTQLIKKIKQISAEYKFGDFFRNFIAVVLGIILTFAGSDWIANRKTQKDIKRTIELIRQELSLNKRGIQDDYEYILFDQQAARYLLQYKDSMDAMPEDSIMRYGFSPFQTRNTNYSDDALEMLKSSALIQQINNKELAFQIIRTYALIKDASISFKDYMDIKKEYQQVFISVPELKKYMNSKRGIEDGIRNNWKYYFQFPEGVSLVNQIPMILDASRFLRYVEQIDSTIAAINKEYY